MRSELMGVEAWRGLTFVGVISIEWFIREFEGRLEDLAQLSTLHAELAAPADRALPAPQESAWRPLLRRPPALVYDPVPKALRTARRHARRTRPKPRKPLDRPPGGG